MTVVVLGRRLPAAATYAAALGGALFLLVAVLGAALWQSSAVDTLRQSVRESVERRGHLRVFLQQLTSIESGQRGYLLTGEAAYLEPYASARARIEAELAALEGDAAGNAVRTAEAAQMRALTQRKLAEIEATVALMHSGRTGPARRIVATDLGIRLMDDLRAIVGRAEARENAALARDLQRSESLGSRLRFIILLAGTLILGIGALLVVTVRGAMAELRASRDEAQAARDRAIEEMAVRAQAEAKVRQLQKMETIGQLTGGVAHDFNNMLAVIMSALQLARRRLDRGEPGADRFIDAAVEGAERAAALTGRLLAFARRKPLQPQVIDVNRTLSDMSDMLRRTLGETIQLATVLAGGIWRVHADRNELEQAILNVCVNARDAMPGGGKLTVESANCHLDEAYAAANPDVTEGQYVLIAVTDTGAGMAAEVKAQAFEPFFTTKPVGAGTGLGLSHVHGFIKQSGGHVAIYSEVGVGTTVKLYLPRTALNEAEVRAPPRQSEEAPRGDPATLILVVEDEARVRALSVAALRDLGYSVLHASGGPQALSLIEANPGIALLFTDVVMPEMSGRVLAEEACKRRPALKVLYTTGYTQNAIVHNGVVDADARLILKPYTLLDLARKVRAALDA